MLELRGVTQQYDWGTVDAIPHLLGETADGEPHAEYWLGAHPLSAATTAQGSLADVIAANPEILGRRPLNTFGPVLPFLFKVLSAQHPLSLQAHPDRQQAEEGFTRENGADLPLDDPERVYRDAWPKPEVLVALDRFEALTSFREPTATAELFDGLGVSAELASVIGPLTERKGAAAIAEVFLDALSLEGERKQLLDVLAAAAVKHSRDDGPVGQLAKDVLLLDEVFPGDPAILAALLLNRVTLEPGQAFFVPPGQMHVYLRGTGIEVMANSDNVIRGGLTPKHVDVRELVRVVDFEPKPIQIIEPAAGEPGVLSYPVPCEEFALWRLDLTPELGWINLPGRGSARIAFTTVGQASVASGSHALTIGQGDAILAGADEDTRIEGHGSVFVTAAGLR
ncbi:MAG: mannose-6-phosphate isomerase, class I [Propionibacteriaceae bacterium]|jgi:mannose-6-phosphate isomerase|nr:mannose-6-phosphate isomerase, class I [Propionibacteriaceae bacterium]